MIDTKDNFKNLGPGVAEDAALNRFLMVSSVSVDAFKKMIGPGGVAESVKCHQHHFAADSCAIRVYPFLPFSSNSFKSLYLILITLKNYMEKLRLVLCSLGARFHEPHIRVPQVKFPGRQFESKLLCVGFFNNMDVNPFRK